jgi:hypothetical protein
MGRQKGHVQDLRGFGRPQNVTKYADLQRLPVTFDENLAAKRWHEMDTVKIKPLAITPIFRHFAAETLLSTGGGGRYSTQKWLFPRHFLRKYLPTSS